MKVVILCGGLGTRLREETEFRPKALVMVGDRPIVWHVMKMYAHHGFKEFVLCLGYKGEMIKDYFLNYDLRNSSFTVKLGSKEVTLHDSNHEEMDWQVTLVDTGRETMTGGRIARIEPYIGEDDFMATYGDGVADIDIPALLAVHRRAGKIATMSAVNPVGRFGELSIRANLVTIFQEKPENNGTWINGGFFVFNRQIFSFLDGDDCVLEREPLQRLAIEGQLAAHKHCGYWQCMDTQRDALALNQVWDMGQAPWKVW